MESIGAQVMEPAETLPSHPHEPFPPRRVVLGANFLVTVRGVTAPSGDSRLSCTVAVESAPCPALLASE